MFHLRVGRYIYIISEIILMLPFDYVDKIKINKKYIIYVYNVGLLGNNDNY